jgi:hypothetical protein
MAQLVLVYVLKALLAAAFALGGLGPAAPLALDGFLVTPPPAEAPKEPAPEPALARGPHVYGVRFE